MSHAMSQAAVKSGHGLGNRLDRTDCGKFTTYQHIISYHMMSCDVKIVKLIIQIHNSYFFIHSLIHFWAIETGDLLQEDLVSVYAVYGLRYRYRIRNDEMTMAMTRQ